MKNKKSKIGKDTIKGFLIFILVFVCIISVTSEVHAAQINKKSLTLLKGKTYTLKVTGSKNKPIWKTSNKKAVKIISKTKQRAKIKAVKVGKANITAKIGNKSYKCKVVVVDPKLSKSKHTLKAGDKLQLKVTGGKGTIKWKSSNIGAVKVNKKGIVTAIRIGTSKVTASQNGKTMTCTVKVTAKVPGSNSGGGSSEDSDDTKDETDKRKRWVVTKEAEIEYRPIYGSVTTELECSCGFKIQYTEETEEDEMLKWDSHIDWESDSCVSYKVNDVTPIIDYERIEHPEEGYWEYY